MSWKLSPVVFFPSDRRDGLTGKDRCPTVFVSGFFFFFYCLGSNLFFVLNSKSRKKIFKCVMLWLFIFKGSAVWGSNTCLPLMEIVLGQFPKLPLHQTVNTHLSKGHKGIIKAQLESDNGTALLLCDSILICRLLKLNVRHCFLIREETVKGWEYNKG